MFHLMAKRLFLNCVVCGVIFSLSLLPSPLWPVVVYSYNCTNTYTNICLHAETSLTGNDDFNKRTNTLLYKNISLILYSRKGDVCCVWEMSWRQGQTAILTQVLLATIAALLPLLDWGYSTEGHRGPKALYLPLALTSASCLQLTRTVCAPGYIIV